MSSPRRPWRVIVADATIELSAFVVLAALVEVAIGWPMPGDGIGSFGAFVLLLVMCDLLAMIVRLEITRRDDAV